METIRKIGTKISKWFKKTVMNIILHDKKNEAKWKNKRTGQTHYVVALNWHDVRVLNKGEYDYCKKWLQKRRGKDIRKNLMYRADHTLVRNPDFEEFL